MADSLLKQLLARYPELAVPSKNVPPERNGFLKWLELCDRFDPDHNGTPAPNTAFPKELTDHLGGKAPWNAEAVRNWLAKENAFLSELRAIGLMPEQSVEGIDVHRYSFISARFAKGCAEALLMDARLAAEEGDVSRAMASVQAANGIAAHLGNVETPTLLAITVQILIQLQVQSYSLSEILPALPAGQLDPVAWGNVVNPVVSQPAEFARIMKGEWNVTSREYLLPMLCDTEDPRYPSDPEALLDFHAGGFVDVVKTHEAASLPDLPNLEFGDIGDNSHLSRSSRQLTDALFIGARAWRKGWDRTQSAAAMGQAAFAILKGETPPNDPIYGQPYRWDPVSRTLSAPDSPEFKDLDLKPIKIPKP